MYAEFFHALYQTPVVVARIFMVYGPGQLDLTKVVPYSVLRGLDGEPAQLASGTRLTDWIHVDDAVTGLLTLAEAPDVEGQVIDLGSGDLVTVGEIVSRIAVKLGSPPPTLGALPDRPLERVRRADVEATSRCIGFRPKIS